jgi:hypothetical protein
MRGFAGGREDAAGSNEQIVQAMHATIAIHYTEAWVVVHAGGAGLMETIGGLLHDVSEALLRRPVIVDLSLAGGA